MTQKDKQLVLADLCARLPYKVEVAFQVANYTPDIRTFTGKDYDYLKFYHFIDEFTKCTFKPYLRPMSSMTEEEIEEYHSLCFDEEREVLESGEWVTRVYYHDTIDSIDWLNKKKFDYRGLIPKDLAISTEVFNPYKN